MKRKVLLIEDDRAYRESLKFVFSDGPYDFVEAASPEEGLAVLAENPQIQVILLDLSFLSGSGTAVLDAIKEHSANYRVIVLTGRDELLRAERAEEYDVFHYLPKAQKSTKQAIRFSLDQAFKDLERHRLDRKVRYLIAVQKKINSNCDITETLDLICRSIRDTLDGFTCHIRVYHVKYGDYHLKGFAGPDEKLRALFARPKSHGELYSGKVVETGIAAVLEDLPNLPEFHELAAKELAGGKASPEEQLYWRTVRSAYVVPISTGVHTDAVDVVINVSSSELAYFTPERQAQVGEFVMLAGLAITKDWLQKKRDEIHDDYSRIAGMLSEISDALEHPDDFRGIYSVVTRRISQIIDPEVVSIFLFNETTQLLENVAERRGGEDVDRSEVYRRRQSLTGSVFDSEKTLLLNKNPLKDVRFDQANEEAYLRDIPSGTLQHYLAAPIRIGGRAQGVLRVMNKKSAYYDAAPDKRVARCLLERGFSGDCRNVVEITASHLAVAIRNAELLKKIESLGQVGRLINSERTIDEVLRLTIEKMADVMQAKICMLFLKEGEDRVVLRQCFGMPMIADAFYFLGKGLTGAVAQTGKPVLLPTAPKNDGKYDREIREFLISSNSGYTRIESLMIVPIIAKGTILGAMKVINKERSQSEYSAADLQFFQTFADYVGVAIENAQIYEVTNERLAIAERNAALSTLVRAVAHEINNTSGLIPTNVSNIKAALGPTNQRVTRMLDRIDEVASQAVEFANEIAGFSAKRSGKRIAQDVNLAVPEAIADLTDDPKYRGSGLNGILQLSLFSRPLICEIYRTPFIQVIRNIVINAFQAVGDKSDGQILVSISAGWGESEGNAIIRIQDNGHGIKPEHMPKIFDSDFTTKSKGNGVGLWLVRTHLEQIGGKITVESSPENGATFEVTLPIFGGRGKEGS